MLEWLIVACSKSASLMTAVCLFQNPYRSLLSLDNMLERIM